MRLPSVVEFKADMPRIAEPPSLATSVHARHALQPLIDLIDTHVFAAESPSRDPVNVLLRSAERGRSGEGCFVRFDGDRPNGMVKDVVIGSRHVVALWDWQSTNRTTLPKSR